MSAERKKSRHPGSENGSVVSGLDRPLLTLRAAFTRRAAMVLSASAGAFSYRAGMRPAEVILAGSTACTRATPLPGTLGD
jgi:hypothetical protein